jgi:hypothetical protein
MTGEFSSGTGLAHRWLRQRGLFAELRALEEREKASRDETSGDGNGKPVSIRLGQPEATLLSEAVACSHYRHRSAYLQATATGRDRRAPILAKGGLLFCWVRAHLGDKVGPEEQRQLQRFTQFLFGIRVEEALALIRRHLRAARLAAGDRLGDGEDLPPVPESVRCRMPQDPSPKASFRVCGERRRLIKENVTHSAYDNMSEYIRHLAFGWDRNAEPRAQCAMIAEWLEDCRKDQQNGFDGQSGLDGQGGLDGQVGPEEWDQLEEAIHRRFGVFLSGPGAPGQVDVEGALRRGANHLLGAAPERFASRVPAQC